MVMVRFTGARGREAATPKKHQKSRTREHGNATPMKKRAPGLRSRVKKVMVMVTPSPEKSDGDGAIN